jgi:hypothetical protein
MLTRPITGGIGVAFLGGIGVTWVFGGICVA